MTVYVDSPIWSLGRMKMCHMMADTREELFEMVDKIGVARKHFQNTKYPHFDICKSKRELAIQHGAIPVSGKELIKLFRDK